jgi:hypothetical protein
MTQADQKAALFEAAEASSAGTMGLTELAAAVAVDRRGGGLLDRRQ